MPVLKSMSRSNPHLNSTFFDAPFDEENSDFGFRRNYEKENKKGGRKLPNLFSSMRSFGGKKRKGKKRKEGSEKYWTPLGSNENIAQIHRGLGLVHTFFPGDVKHQNERSNGEARNEAFTTLQEEIQQHVRERKEFQETIFRLTTENLTLKQERSVTGQQLCSLHYFQQENERILKRTQFLEDALADSNRRIVAMETDNKTLLKTMDQQLRQISIDVQNYEASTQDFVSHEISVSKQSICEALDSLGNKQESIHKVVDDLCKGLEGLGQMECIQDVDFQHLPQDVKEFCDRLVELVGINWRDLARALRIPSYCINNISYLEQFGLPEVFWNVIGQWFTMSCSPVSVQTLLQAVESIGVRPLEVEPMPSDQKDILQKHRAYLCRELMDVSIIEPYLSSSMLLTPTQRAYIVFPSTKHERILRLLDILPTMGDRALKVLCAALKHTDQQHIADTLIEAERAQASRRNSKTNGNRRRLSSSVPGMSGYQTVATQTLRETPETKVSFKANHPQPYPKTRRQRSQRGSDCNRAFSFSEAALTRHSSLASRPHSGLSHQSSFNSNYCCKADACHPREVFNENREATVAMEMANNNGSRLSLPETKEDQNESVMLRAVCEIKSNVKENQALLGDIIDAMYNFNNHQCIVIN